MTFRVALALIVLLAWPATARADVSAAMVAALEREAADLGAIAATGVSADPLGLDLRNARSRMASLVIAAIAQQPGERHAILAAASAAAPGLAAGIRADAAAAFPGFAADLSTGSPPDAIQGATEARAVAPAARLEVGAPGSENAADPLEDVNRVTFAVNDALDTLILRPIAFLYGAIVPLPIKTGVANAYHNLKSPVILANDLLQGNVTDAAPNTLGRFVVNSTIGLLGFIDMAATFGMPWHDTDFGETLFTYGAGPGPYLVLPLLGPSNARDAVGSVVDNVLDPLGFFLPQDVKLGLTAGKAVSKREAIIDQLDQLRDGSLDYYAAVRSIYFQKRAEELGVAPIAGSSGEAADPFAEFE